MRNLVVDLRGERFAAEEEARLLRTIESAGFAVSWLEPGASEHLCAWIDEEFGGCWSSEAFSGRTLVAMRGSEFAGFATIQTRERAFFWLNPVPAQGLFGPFGVAPQFRGGELGSALLKLALGALARRGYERALIPAVTEGRLCAYYERVAGAKTERRFELRTPRRFRAVAMVSGSGTNLQSVIENAAQGVLPLDLAAVVSNRADAFALRRARDAQIPAVALPWDRSAQSRETYDAALLDLVRREEPDVVLLLGWMHLLDDRFVSNFANIVNVHPAYLPLDQLRNEVIFPDGSVSPAFRGAHAVRDVLSWGASWIGATVHRVTLETDRGPVLARKPLRVGPGECEHAVLERLHPVEHRTLAAGLLRWSYEQPL